MHPMMKSACNLYNALGEWLLSIWKLLSILGTAAGLFLICSGLGMPEPLERLAAMAGGIGAANFALLAIIIDRLTVRKKSGVPESE